MTYTIKFSNAAQREYNNLDAKAQAYVSARIAVLAVDPRPIPHSKKQGPVAPGVNRYRLRMGDHYRALYDVHDAARLVVVIAVGTHENFYKRH